MQNEASGRAWDALAKVGVEADLESSETLAFPTRSLVGLFLFNPTRKPAGELYLSFVCRLSVARSGLGAAAAGGQGLAGQGGVVPAAPPLRAPLCAVEAQRLLPAGGRGRVVTPLRERSPGACDWCSVLPPASCACFVEAVSGFWRERGDLSPGRRPAALAGSAPASRRRFVHPTLTLGFPQTF